MSHDDDQSEININSSRKNYKCTCCKEFGHNANECPKDPNIKTNSNIKEDLNRIQKL